MRAAVVEGPRKVALRELADPVPDGRALVAVVRAGLCGTDLKIVEGSIPVSHPRVLGHEIVGTVVEPGAAGLVAAGDRVLVNPSVSCGACDLCLTDREHLCRHGALLGRDVDGGFAPFVAVNERQLHVLPSGLDPDAAALLQVLGTCVHAQTLVEVFPGQVAVVLGLGVSGLLHLQLLRARGLTTVIGVGRSPAKLALARELGAATVTTPEEAPSLIADLTGGRGADLVVEAVGTVRTLGQAVDFAGIGATVLVFGTITEREGPFPYYDLYFKELDLRNPRAARPRDYVRAVDLATRGAVRLAPLVTSSFPLEEVTVALATCRGDRSQLKVTLDIA